MKYLKYFQESSLFRDVNPEIKQSTYTKPFRGANSFVYDNKFDLGDYTFSCYFQEMHSPIEHWEGVHGYFQKTMFGDELHDTEIHLNYTDTLNLMQIISNITTQFLNEKKPNILVLNHKDMDNEVNKDIFKTKLNKRARIIYNYIKNKIPQGYVLSYWFNNYYQDDDSCASTACIIYKENEDISKLIEQRIKLPSTGN